MFKPRILAVTLACICIGCSSRSEQREVLSPAAAASAEQPVVDAATRAVRSMRESGNFPTFDYFAAHARGVLIFPNTVKAALVFGGEGGKGVLLAKSEDGTWSAPAFYSIGGGSVGFQIGYEKASIVLFLMNEHTLMSVIDHGLTLGADVSVAAGTVGESGRAITATTAADVVQFVEAGGLYAGASLKGAVVASRDRANRLYYGPDATTTAIVLARRFDHPAAAALRDALATKP